MERPRIRKRKEWGARKPRARTRARLVSGMVDHWGGLPAVRDGDPAATLRAYQDYHMDSKGWLDIAYNFAVGQDGSIWECRGWDVANGATAPGAPNRTLTAVCYLAGADYRDGRIAYADRLTDEAKWAMAWLWCQWVDRHGGIGPRSVHRQWYQTSCPGDELAAWWLSPDADRRITAVTDGRAPWDEGTPPPPSQPPRTRYYLEDAMQEHRATIGPDTQAHEFWAVPAHGDRWDTETVFSSKLNLYVTDGLGPCRVDLYQTADGPTHKDELTVGQLAGLRNHELRIGGRVGLAVPKGRTVIAVVRYGPAVWPARAEAS